MVGTHSYHGKQYLKRDNKACRAPKKASQQIFTSADWEVLKRGADK